MKFIYKLNNDLKTAVSLTCEQRSSIRGVRHSWSNIFTGFNRPTTPETREIILWKYHLHAIKRGDGFQVLYLEMKKWAKKWWRNKKKILRRHKKALTDEKDWAKICKTRTTLLSPAYMEKSWPGKESHPPSQVNFNECFIWEKSCSCCPRQKSSRMLWLPKISAHACSTSVYFPLMHRENQHILALTKSANYLMYINRSISLGHIPEQIFSSFPATELQ